MILWTQSRKRKSKHPSIKCNFQVCEHVPATLEKSFLLIFVEESCSTESVNPQQRLQAILPDQPFWYGTFGYPQIAVKNTDREFTPFNSRCSAVFQQPSFFAVAFFGSYQLPFEHQVTNGFCEVQHPTFKQGFFFDATSDFTIRNAEQKQR